MLFVHLSTDSIILHVDGHTQVLPYLDIERKLPPLLHTLLADHRPSAVWVINGPGSFTTLRLGCLALRTIQQYGPYAFDIYSCSKLDIYTYAVAQGVLPAHGLIYIGQKKNMWYAQYGNDDGDIYDGWSCRIINHATIDMVESSPYFIDPCAHVLLTYLDTDAVVTWSYTADALQLEYKTGLCHISPQDLGLSPVDDLVPQYMLAPQIG